MQHWQLNLSARVQFPSEAIRIVKVVEQWDGPLTGVVQYTDPDSKSKALYWFEAHGSIVEDVGPRSFFLFSSLRKLGLKEDEVAPLREDEIIGWFSEVGTGQQFASITLTPGFTTWCLRNTERKKPREDEAERALLKRWLLYVHNPFSFDVESAHDLRREMIGPVGNRLKKAWEEDCDRIAQEAQPDETPLQELLDGDGIAHG